MTYLCLIFAGAGQPATFGESTARDGQPEFSSLAVGAGRAAAGAEAVTLHYRQGELSIVEGTALRDEVASPEYVVLEARDLNDAIRLARRMVPAFDGWVELRPILPYGTGR